MTDEDKDKYLDYLRNRAWDGETDINNGLTDEEIAWLVQELQESTNSNVQMSIIKTLGILDRQCHRGLIESFLTVPDCKPAHMALFVLCVYWGKTADYIEQVAAFIRGVDWDTFGDCRFWAVGIAGRYLEEAYEPRLIDALLESAEREQEDEQDGYWDKDRLIGYLEDLPGRYDMPHSVAQRIRALGN